MTTLLDMLMDDLVDVLLQYQVDTQSFHDDLRAWIEDRLPHLGQIVFPRRPNDRS